MDKAKNIEVGVVMGSDSDWPLLKQTASTLDSFGVGYEVRVISAHRSPAVATAYSSSAQSRGLKVIIAAAGSAAHLGGVLAAHTILPVIGIPVKGGAMDGLDALLSTVQMPAGIPVGTVALGNAGAVNAAILAVQILALGNPQLAQRLALHKKALADKVAAADEKLQTELNANKAG